MKEQTSSINKTSNENKNKEDKHEIKPIKSFYLLVKILLVYFYHTILELFDLLNLDFKFKSNITFIILSTLLRKQNKSIFSLTLAFFLTF